MASKQGHNQPGGGGGGGGGGGRVPLQWISQAVKDELNALSPKIRSNAEQYYLFAVERLSRPKKSIYMEKAKEQAKTRLNNLKKNLLLDPETGALAQGKAVKEDKLMF